MNREPDWTWWNEARAIARRHARGASDAADDLAQELAVAVLERGATLERPGAWLERVGRNAGIDRWRVDRRRGELATGIPSPTTPPDPEAGALARERRGVLRRALAGLPRPLRRATLARFHADLPFDDVAARLGTEPATARTRVHRALARLRASLGALRGVFVGLPGAGLPGAQATILGLTLVMGVARPALVPGEASVAPRAVLGVPTRVPGRRLARASAPRVVAPAPPAPVAAPLRRPAAAGGPSAPASTSPPVVQRYSFDSDVVEGALAAPDETMLLGDRRTTNESLIELRRTFLPEIAKTLEDL